MSVSVLPVDPPPLAAPSPLDGLGAVLVRDTDGRVAGTSFRVWAPHAEAVWVTGSFCGWAEGVALAPEPGGLWSAFVPGVGAGTAYKFRLRTGNRTFLRHDPRARWVSHSSGDSLVYDPDAFDWEGVEAPRHAREDFVVYELHIGTFGPSDPWAVATFDAAIARLDYLAALGVTAVELMPVAEFPGDRSWGYNVAHPFAVETSYGGPDGLKRFVCEAHRRGMAVFHDLVYNHFGPSDLDLWQFDGWSENGGGGIYFYNDRRAATPWGDTRPDYGRAEVRDYLVDNARMWLSEYRLDGLRLDMALFIRSTDGSMSDESLLHEGWAFMQQLCDTLRAEHPHALLVAEDLQNDPTLVRETALGGAGFDAQWSAGFVHPVRHVLEATDDDHRSAAVLAKALAARYEGDPFRRVVYTESHDEVANGRQRLVSEVGEAHGRQRASLAAALVCTAPGIPMLFQGQAMLAEGWFRDDVPVDWSRPQEVSGHVLLWRDLIARRRNLHGTSGGLRGPHVSILLRDEARGLLAFQRWAWGGPGDDVVVVVNLHAAAAEVDVPFPHAGAWRLAVNTGARVYDPEAPEVASHDVWMDPATGKARVAVPPYAALLYERL